MEDDPVIGQHVGRYRIERALGEGGMGRVYSAVNPEIGARVAIKILHANGARDDSIVERFFAEARAVNVIRHENIVNILDLSTMPDGRPYIVMEHLSGAPLSKLIVPGVTLPITGLVHVILDVLAALDAAHAAGIVHRDLKPDNIFVTPEGNGKVLDFGIAKLMPEHGATQTREGLVFGTPLYMSPEQVTQGSLDARSDLYSIGVVLYEATTGEWPYEATSTYEILTAHVEQKPKPPRERRAELSEAIDALILRALSKDPGQRFASAIEMASALADAVRGIPNEPLLPPASRRVSSPIATVSAPAVTGETKPFSTASTPSTVSASQAPVPRPFERHRGRAWGPILIGGGLAVVVALIVLAMKC